MQPPEKTIRSPAELFQTPTYCKSDGSCHVGSSDPVFLTLGVPHASNPVPAVTLPHPAGWLPPELLASWTRCAQPPSRALRRMPPLEPEEAAAEREAVAEEERKAEVPSDIEVTAPSLLPERLVCFAHVSQWYQAIQEPRPVQHGDCFTPGDSVMLGALSSLSLIPRS